MTTWIANQGLKGVCLNVTLPKSGPVRILFVSDGKKNWNAILCTDLEMELSEILSYYARRWSIEVFFKDAKVPVGFCLNWFLVSVAVAHCILGRLPNDYIESLSREFRNYFL